MKGWRWELDRQRVAALYINKEGGQLLARPSTFVDAR